MTAPPVCGPMGLASTVGLSIPDSTKLLGRVLLILSQKNSSSVSAGGYIIVSSLTIDYY